MTFKIFWPAVNFHCFSFKLHHFISFICVTRYFSPHPQTTRISRVPGLNPNVGMIPVEK